MNWSKEFPKEDGDYLWVAMWGCGCCVRSYDICFIRDANTLGLLRLVYYLVYSVLQTNSKCAPLPMVRNQILIIF
jgi:hypothetical protein